MNTKDKTNPVEGVKERLASVTDHIPGESFDEWEVRLYRPEVVWKTLAEYVERARRDDLLAMGIDVERAEILLSDHTRLEAEVARLRASLEWFDRNAQTLKMDVRSAHYSRGNGTTQWMVEDDQDFRRDLASALESAPTTLGDQ